MRVALQEFVRSYQSHHQRADSRPYSSDLVCFPSKHLLSHHKIHLDGRVLIFQNVDYHEKFYNRTKLVEILLFRLNPARFCVGGATKLVPLCRLVCPNQFYSSFVSNP